MVRPGAMLRAALSLNSEILLPLARKWVEIFDFEGCGGTARTCPIKILQPEAGHYTEVKIKEDVCDEVTCFIVSFSHCLLGDTLLGLDGRGQETPGEGPQGQDLRRQLGHSEASFTPAPQPPNGQKLAGH